MEKPVNPAGSRGLKLTTEPVPTAVETLEHLEQTLDNLDPVLPAYTDEAEQSKVDALDAAADSVIAEITGGDPSVDAFEPPPAVPEGTLETIGGDNTVDPERV